MKKTILLFTCLIITLFLSNAAFSTNIDSLETLLKSASAHDKCRLMNELAKEYSDQDMEKSMLYANDALKESRQNNDKIEEAKALYNIAENSRKTRNLADAEKYNNEALDIFISINDPEGIAGCYVLSGIIQKNNENYEQAISFYNKAIEIAKKINDEKILSKSYNNAGNVFQLWGNYDKAIEYFTNAQKLKEKTGDKKGSGVSYSNIGNCYFLKSEYEKAAESYQKALTIFEAINFKEGVAKCFNSIGMINENWKNSSKAIEYYEKALNIYTELGDKTGIAEIYNNIGNAYSGDSLFTKALDYYNKSLEINQEIDNKIMIGKSYINIGYTYTVMGKPFESFKYLDNALTTFQDLNNPYEIANCYNAMGQTFRSQKRYEKSIEFFNKSLDMALKNGITSMVISNYQYMAEVYELVGDYKKALEIFKKFYNEKESVFSVENNKAIKQLQTIYETEKKEQQISLLNKDKEIQDSKIRQQNFIIYGFVFGFLVIISFIILIYRQYQQKKKANRELEQKNALITHQKNEITDSIHYAERIQRAMLPHSDYIKKYIPDHFVLFKPKDIVSGDFYWMTVKDEKIIIAAADCTGHGVPGAFMSMLGVSFLNEIINDKNVLEPDKILNLLRENIINALQQTGEAGTQKDGMDMSLCCINTQNKTIEFAAANNPMYFLKNETIVEYKADKMPVAIHPHMEPFAKTIINYESNDCIYIFSDGFADQFGGPQGKKFKYKPFKDIIIKHRNLPMDFQKNELNNEIEHWKSFKDAEGNPYAQIDDILVIGIRLKA